MISYKAPKQYIGYLRLSNDLDLEVPDEGWPVHLAVACLVCHQHDLLVRLTSEKPPVFCCGWYVCKAYVVIRSPGGNA